MNLQTKYDWETAACEECGRTYPRTGYTNTHCKECRDEVKGFNEKDPEFYEKDGSEDNGGDND